MALGIIGKKIGMTQLYNAEGHLVPVTVIQAGPCPIVQTKTVDNDGYNAIQIGYGKAGRKKTLNKPYRGHFKASKIEPTAALKEFRLDDIGPFEIGQELSVDIFKITEKVSVTGYSKGMGFTGVMARHGYAGKEASHGTHEAVRHGGSIGARTPKRTVKGRKMPGRMGNQRFTIKNLKIMLIDKQNNLLMIKGAVPGARGGLVIVRKAEREVL